MLWHTVRVKCCAGAEHKSTKSVRLRSTWLVTRLLRLPHYPSNEYNSTIQLCHIWSPFNPLNPMSDQYWIFLRILKHYEADKWSEERITSIRKLLLVLISNSLKYHHENCTADSKENLKNGNFGVKGLRSTQLVTRLNWVSHLILTFNRMQLKYTTYDLLVNQPSISLSTLTDGAATAEVKDPLDLSPKTKLLASSSVENFLYLAPGKPLT